MSGVGPVHLAAGDFPLAGFGLILLVSSSNALCVAVVLRGQSLGRNTEPEWGRQGEKQGWDC